MSRVAVDKTLEAFELTRNARDSALMMLFSAATIFIVPLAFSYFTASSLDAGETFVITVTSIASAAVFVRGTLIFIRLSSELSDSIFLTSVTLPKHPRFYLLNRMLGIRSHAA
jgi:hypothetical protein